MNKDTDVKAITRKLFAAYNAHDVEGMLALCADGAQGRYLPYGKKSLMPIRGGLEQIWRGLLGTVPDFSVEVDEMIQAEGHIVVVQALLGGAMPADVPGLVTKGKSDRIAHAYIIRYNADGKITRLDCYWDNTAINAFKASVLLGVRRNRFELVSGYLRCAEGAVRNRHHAYVRMACRSARPHGPHDQGERRAFPEGDGQGLQDCLAGIHLRDRCIGGRVRGPEEPVEGMDEAGRGADSNLPGQDRPQGDDLSRAIRRGIDHWAVQRALAVAGPPGARSACSGQHLHSHPE